MKAHLLAGKVEVPPSSGISDHAWMSRNECKSLLDQDYYSKIESILI